MFLLQRKEAIDAVVYVIECFMLASLSYKVISINFIKIISITLQL